MRRTLLTLAALTMAFTLAGSGAAAPGNGNGRGENGPPVQVAERKAEKAAEREQGKEDKQAERDARQAQRTEVGGDRFPTSNAQRALAHLIESGKVPPHAAEVLVRVLVKLQDRFGAAVAVPALTDTVASGD